MSKLCFCVLVVSMTHGCVYKNGTSYPYAYTQAISQTEGVRPTADNIAMWIDFFSQLEPDNERQKIPVSEVYAKNVYFSDSLMHTHRVDDIAAHFERLRNNGTSVNLRILNTIIQDQDAYVIWQMESRFKPMHQFVKSNTIGATHLRFNSEGKVILHQDFLDTGFGFNRHIPMLGYAIKAVESRFKSSVE